ncbi:hypothetical protein CHS0354_039719 [Potamilus streckersoni]|uniref:Uncharacterized protein n=1 Tax=Potamilus streckersoni TaxID=2493646 RepID=A0AAE0WAG0_9BIVA|nr:hypothetical protein CHS0354_039719 [Potamilus streckersoni]
MTENFDSDIIIIESDDESCPGSVGVVTSHHDSYHFESHVNDPGDSLPDVDDPDEKFLRDLELSKKLSLQERQEAYESRRVLFDNACGPSTSMITQADKSSLRHNRYGKQGTKISSQRSKGSSLDRKNADMALKSELLHRSTSETSVVKDSGVNWKKTLSYEREGNVNKEEVGQPNFRKRHFSDRIKDTSGDGHDTNVKYRHSSGDPKQRHNINVKDEYVGRKSVCIDGHQRGEKESYKKCLKNEISLFQSIKKEKSSNALTDRNSHLNYDKNTHSRNNKERYQGGDAFDEKDNSSIDRYLSARNNSIMNERHSNSFKEVRSGPNKMKNWCKISRPLSTEKACKGKKENEHWQIREDNESGLKRHHSFETKNEQVDITHSSSKRPRQSVSESGQPVLEPILFTLDLSQEYDDFSDGSLPDLEPPTIERVDVFSETDSYLYKTSKLSENGDQQDDLPCNVIEFMSLDNNEERSESKERSIDDQKGTECKSVIASLGKNSHCKLERKSDSSSKQRSGKQRDKQLSSSESICPGFYSEFKQDVKSSKTLNSQSSKSVRSLWHSLSDNGKARFIDDDYFQGILDSDDARSYCFHTCSKNITCSESLKNCQNSLQVVTSEPNSENLFVSKGTDVLSKEYSVFDKEGLKPWMEKNNVQDLNRTGRKKFEIKLHKSQSCSPIMEANCSTRTNIFEAFFCKKDNDKSIPPMSELSPQAKKTLKEKLELFKSKIKTPLRVKDRSQPDLSGALDLQKKSSQDSRHFLDVIQKKPTVLDGNVRTFGKEETMSPLPVNLLQKSKLKKLFAAHGLEVNNEKSCQDSDAKDENYENMVLVSDVEHSTSDRKCIDEPKSVMQTSEKPIGEKAVLLPIIPTVPEIKSNRTSITRKVNVSLDSKFGKVPVSKENIKSYFLSMSRSSTSVLISSLETRKKILIVPSSRFPFESMLDSTCKQMTQLHINIIEGCFDDGMLFLSHALKFLNDVCFRYKPTSDMVGRIVTSAFQDKNVSIHLVQNAYQTLMMINQIYPGLIRVDWILIENCLNGIVSSRSCGSSTGTQTQAYLLLSLATDVLLDDLFNRDISDQRQIHSSMAFKVLSYDTSRSNIEVIVDYIRCILCGLSDHAISAGLAQDSANRIEYKVLPILQRLLDLAVNVSRSCEDCATYIATRLLQMYIYLPCLSHKSLLLQTIMSDLLALKLSQLVLEKEYDNIMPLGGFPDSLASVFESFFSAVPYKNHLTPPTTPTSDNDDNGVARSTTEDIIDPTTCEELCMLLFYSVKSYLISSQGKLYVALRRRAQYGEKEHCTLRSQDVDNLEEIPVQLENLRERLLSMTREITMETEHYLMLMNCFSQLGLTLK